MEHRVSKRFLIELKFCGRPQYAVARQADLHPNLLSKLIHGFETVKPRDPRILAVGAVLGLRPEDCFEPDNSIP